MNKTPIILDTDIGIDIDDTWALTMLLNCPELAPRLVLTASGDTVYRSHLVAKLLEIAGRTEIPIGIGLNSPENTRQFQLPWLDGFDIASYSGTIHEDGIRAMIDLIMNSSELVTIISIAATPNIARALEIEPRIANKCKYVGMQGSINLGYDNQQGVSPEANVAGDVPALRKVFAAPWQEITITPLDTCGLVVLAGERYQQIYRSEHPILKALIENYRIWSRLIEAEGVVVDYEDRRSSTLFDTVAIYLAYSHDLVEIESIALCITDDGLTIPHKSGDVVRAALRWKDLDAFLEHLLARLLGGGVYS